MITSARYGMWETNSSTVNQIVIPLNEEVPIPENTKLIIRLVDVSENSDKRDGVIIKDPQGKMDVLVTAIIQYCDVEENLSAVVPIVLMQTVYKLLDSANVKYEFDFNSFKRIGKRYASFSWEIVSALTDILFQENNKLFLNFIFNGHFATDDESNVNEEISEFIIDQRSNEDKYIITD